MKNRIWSAGFFAAILLTFSSCMFLGIGSSPSDTGTIEIILGASGRSVVQASQSTTASYLLEITGSDGSKDSRTLSKNAGSYSISLQPGEYTLTITAISADGKESAWDQQSVTVSVGRTVPVAFQLKAGGYQDTKIYLWNQVTGSTLQRFDSAPEDLMVTDGVSAANSAFAEDRDDNWYFFCYGENGLVLQCCRNNGTSVDLPVPEEFNPIDDGLYYDCSTDMLWACSKTGQLCGFAIADVRSQLGEESSSPIEPRINQIPILNDPAITINTFAVRGSKVYSGYRITDKENSVVTKISVGSIEPWVPDSKTLVVTDLGDCTDLAFVGETLYALVCDYKYGDSSGYSSFDDTWYWNPGYSSYSRGALVQLLESESDLAIGKKVGWSDTHSTEEVDYYPCQAYGPTKAESAAAFFGPRRFVAIKPKELYIVDCGTHIQFTDWAAGRETRVLPVGGEFFHERLVCVDLQSFGMSVLHDITTPNANEQHETSLFVKMSISGANSVISSSSYGDSVKEWVLHEGTYYANEDLSSYTGLGVGGTHGGTFTKEER